MRYETLAPVREIHSASMLFSIYFSVGVICVYKKRAAERKRLQRETKACQMVEADILSSEAQYGRVPF